MDVTAKVQMFVLIATRMSPIFLASAVSPFRSIPMMIKLVLLLVFSTIIFALNYSTLVLPKNIILAFIVELLTGSVILFSLVAAYAAILTVGRVVDLQIGFGAAGVVNPNTSGQEPLIGTIYLLGFTTLFFVLGIHTQLISLINVSFQVLPIGSLPVSLSASHILSLMFSSFSLGLLLFSPIMLVIWCVDVLFGFLSKTMPQANIYFVTLPLKIMIGLFVASATFNYTAHVYKQLFQNALSHLQKMLGG